MVLEEGKKEFRVWSIGCSKGQEPYTMAIIFQEIIRKYNVDLTYSIIATDISEVALDHCRRGLYDYNDIVETDFGIVNRYFKKVDNKYLIDPLLKNNIDFSLFDIVRERRKYPINSVFGNFDIVLCSNVLIYYKDAIKNDITKKIINSMATSGLLVVSSSEIDYVYNQVQHKKKIINSSIINIDCKGGLDYE